MPKPLPPRRTVHKAARKRTIRAVSALPKHGDGPPPLTAVCASCGSENATPNDCGCIPPQAKPPRIVIGYDPRADGSPVILNGQIAAGTITAARITADTVTAIAPALRAHERAPNVRSGNTFPAPDDSLHGDMFLLTQHNRMFRFHEVLESWIPVARPPVSNGWIKPVVEISLLFGVITVAAYIGYWISL